MNVSFGPGALKAALPLVLLLGVTHVRAMEPLEAAELRSFCLPADSAHLDSARTEFEADAASLRLCETYILGFLDGAIATDGRVAENVAAELERAESLADRAVRTRGVARRLAAFGETVYADFCVGTPVPIEEVLTHVVDALAADELASSLTARDIVYTALRRHYSCASRTE